jgi:pyruvate dehydrogenase E2 component (dihydrolipoamide acetyltransferase)
VSFIAYGLGVSVPSIAVKKNGFGAATITSIGALGFKNVFAPFSPGMRSAMICAICQIVNKPIVKNGEIVIAPMINLNFTIDHRFLDGSKAKIVLNAMEEVMNNPEKYCSKV